MPPSRRPDRLAPSPPPAPDPTSLLRSALPRPFPAACPVGTQVWCDMAGTAFEGLPPWPGTVAAAAAPAAAAPAAAAAASGPRVAVLFSDGSTCECHPHRVRPLAGSSIPAPFQNCAGAEVPPPPEPLPSRDPFCLNWRFAAPGWSPMHREHTRWEDDVVRAAEDFVRARAGEEALAGTRRIRSFEKRMRALEKLVLQHCGKQPGKSDDPPDPDAAPPSDSSAAAPTDPTSPGGYSGPATSHCRCGHPRFKHKGRCRSVTFMSNVAGLPTDEWAEKSRNHRPAPDWIGVEAGDAKGPYNPPPTPPPPATPSKKRSAASLSPPPSLDSITSLASPPSLASPASPASPAPPPPSKARRSGSPPRSRELLSPATPPAPDSGSDSDSSGGGGYGSDDTAQKALMAQTEAFLLRTKQLAAANKDLREERGAGKKLKKESKRQLEAARAEIAALKAELASSADDGQLEAARAEAAELRAAGARDAKELEKAGRRVKELEGFCEDAIKSMKNMRARAVECKEMLQ
ncbi:hypothetical protein TeGR_g3277 [Tetraparma gracilis]|uniref:Uncharacterized protein n=1 Tax=Tetraparma gracilis TaxID=2962635 RepID=A0ABQ6N824_9STRA|nr:hypothetical protein TeGR_g3277 [Tetraparma gracilis]